MRITITLTAEQWARFTVSCGRSLVTEIPHAVVAKSLFLRGLKLEEDIADESIPARKHVGARKVDGKRTMSKTGMVKR